MLVLYVIYSYNSYLVYVSTENKGGYEWRIGKGGE
jgi:hypothetical protein